MKTSAVEQPSLSTTPRLAASSPRAVARIVCVCAVACGSDFTTTQDYGEVGIVDANKDELIAEIRDLKTGAFAPLSDQPFVQAVLFPGAGLGLLAVAQRLLGIF